ncbi:MAG: hypothetical protein ABR910_12270 [Acidobacteriaceae bacterium]|jgi:hypothetical protein
MLVFDTETRVDTTQRLNFGSYRFISDGKCQEEGLFFGTDLSDRDRNTLERYAAERPANAANKRLKLLTLQEFVSQFYSAAYKGRCLLVGLNLPFDLSRLARGFAEARGRFAGGFSLIFSSYVDESGTEHENRYRPRIAIKHIDGKRALKGFTACKDCDSTDLIPEESATGEPENGYKFRGHFLDLRTLAFALTDRGYTLASACEAFDVEHGKQSAARHGVVADDYIDYNRRDVLATEELATKLLAEYDKHPISLQPTKAYSPASIGKAYLQAMGIRPILERQPDFPKVYLGYAQSAFFGGRAGAHIRKVPVPVVYTDFLSMYPTVNSLMGLWEFVTAREVKIVEYCQDEVTEFLNRVSVNHLFKREAWKNLSAFVQVIPDGDILPSRSKYSAASNDWQVAVNHLHSDAANPDALWYALPDVVASVILTGRVPKIIDAFRLKPIGKSRELKPASLRGAVAVDPRKEDFFKVVIEERKRVAGGKDLPGAEKARLEKALKVVANATSYGIYAEMNRQESDEKTTVVCHGIDPEPFTCSVNHPDVPGRYCFPPLASLITSAARLMLALLEHCVSELGGTYAMEDTDSMAIVATKRGGLLPCAGGSSLVREQPAIKALSWKQIEDIATRFEALNPYDRRAIPGSILKIEGDNFDAKTRKQRQLYCLVISAKRYALFLKDRKGNPELIRKGINNETDRWSEHGLGHLLNPTDPDSEDRQWIGQAWLKMVREALGLPTQNLGFEDRPAVGRLSVSSPAVIRPLANLNKDKPYPEQIKPFNFLLTCYVKPFGHPKGADPTQFHLIAPYDSNATYWLKMDWFDQYTGNAHRIMTTGDSGARRTARVKTYGDLLREYEYHPESKSADSAGEVCGKQTVGLLRRRHLGIDLVRYIGKESNRLEEVDAGLIHNEEGVYTEYTDQSRDEWQMKILPALKRLPLAILIAETGLCRRALLDIRAGRSRPHVGNQIRLIEIATLMGRECDSPARKRPP